jgi:ribosomal protein S18 acetylase RimI-like enzyme
MRLVPRLADGRDSQDGLDFVRNRRREMGLDPDRGADGRSTVDDLVSLQDSYDGHRGKLFLLLEQGQIVGTSAFIRVNESTCELKKVYRDPRIRRSGVGVQLVKFAINAAQRSGYKVMVLQTRPEMTAAIRLYENLGFRKDIGTSTSNVLRYSLDLSKTLP